MSMSKKDFIEIADAIKEHNRLDRLQYGSADVDNDTFSDTQIQTLAAVFKRINPAFMVGRWFDYVAGECGPNGGEVKKGKE